MAVATHTTNDSGPIVENATFIIKQVNEAKAQLKDLITFEI